MSVAFDAEPLLQAPDCASSAARTRYPTAVMVGVLAFSVLMVAWRLPLLIVSPRFWSEEGTIYFEYALHHPWWQTLTAPHLGYYSLIDNVVTWAATFVPLLHAPKVTLLVSFAVQVLPVALIMGSRSPYLAPLQRRIVLAVLVNASPVLSPELWLNIINAQSFLTLAAFLIVLEPSVSARRDAMLLTLLGLCALSAPATAFLVPLAVYRAHTERRPFARHAALVLSAGAALQVLAGQHPATPEDFQHQDQAFYRRGLERPDPLKTVAIALLHNVFHLFYSIFDQANRYAVRGAPGIGLGLYALVAVLTVATRDRLKIAVLLTFTAMALGTTALSLYGLSGPRYAYAPGMVLTWLLLVSLPVTRPAFRPSTLISNGATFLLLTLVCVAGGRTYFSGQAAPLFTRGYDWAEQVPTLSAQHNRIAVWPHGWKDGEDWTIRLPSSALPSLVPEQP